MKKKFLTLICSLLAALLCFSAVACNNGGNGGGSGTKPGGGRDYSTSIQIAYEANTAGSRQTAYKAIAKYWEDNIYGKSIPGLNNGEKINFKIKADAVSSATLADTLNGDTVTYNLVELKEDGSQQVLALNQLDKIDTKEFDVSDISEALMAAYKMEYVKKANEKGEIITYYNVSGENADLYGLPSGTSPSVIFYNTTMMEKSGIAVISMTEEEIAAYNAANKTNLVPRGYHVYSSNPAADLVKVSSTTYNEVNLYGERQENVTGYRVFNNKIAMNWEELYALSAVLTPSYNQNNPGKASEKGFTSEHWFWLGWSVGGDCLSYDEEAGTLKFTLGENARNYMVVAENGVTINGKHFDKGDILDYNARKTLTALEAGSAVKDTTVTKNDLLKENTGDTATVLYEIPSMRDAFTYFCASSSAVGSPSGHDQLHNKMVAGYGVAKPVKDMNNDSFEKSFTEGSVAMMYRDFTIADKFGNKKDWNIAPAPQYKEFDANNNVKTVNGVEVKGYKAAHGETTAYAIPQKAKYKKEAKVIMQWLASNEVQKMFLDYGSEPYYVANSATVNNDAEYKATFANKWSKVTNFNVDVLMDSFNYVTPGDWAYTSKRSEWIAGWASFLHEQVETGKKTLDELFDNPQHSIGDINYTTYTNNLVSKYTYLGIVSHKTVK